MLVDITDKYLESDTKVIEDIMVYNARERIIQLILEEKENRIMERIYRVIAIRRDGVWQYWDPTLSLFTLKETPTNKYHKYTEALREYRRAIEESRPDDMSCVSIHEKMGTDGTWCTLKERQFTQNERSAESIMVDIGTARLSIKTASGNLREVTELSKLSRETRGEIERISNKLYSLSQLMWNLQNKVLEELHKERIES